jgi:ribosomal protein S18 acetylase RimI-like enzyme
VTLADSDAIQYGLLKSADAAAMTGLLAGVFSHHDPPAVAVGLSHSDLEKLVNIFVPKALTECLTITARNSAGEIVGAMLTEDFGTGQPPGIADVPSRFLPIAALLESLDNEYRQTHAVGPGSHLHLFMLGVSDTHSGLGIAQALVTHCLRNGAARGYRYAVTEATGRASQHVFRKLGFRELATASYREFVHRGERAFESIESHGGTILMERSVEGAA